MKRSKILSVIIVFLVATLLASTVSAGGNVKVSAGYSLGSLIADGLATGLGRTDWLLELQASGTASVICTNYGSNDVIGQSSPHVDGIGTQALPGDSQLRKNGKSPFTITAKPDEEINPIISWDAGGCPNPNWTARIDFVYWESATIQVRDPDTGVVVATYNYACTTTRIPQDDGYTFDDGTVSCVPVN
jgi:hypothetical protein